MSPARDSADLVLGEDWSGGIDTARWKHFGSPPATVVSTSSGHAMRNNGDSWFPSGLVTHHRFAMDPGLGIEWIQSAPLTGNLWQEIWVHALTLGLDDFLTWDGEPYPTDPAVITAQTPIIVGQPGPPYLNVTCRDDYVTDPFLEVFDISAPRHVLLQAYPFGRL